MKNPGIRSEEHFVSASGYVPYIGKLTFCLRAEVNQGPVAESSHRICFKVPQFILPSYIYPVVFVDSDRTHHRGIGQREYIPIPAIESEQSFVVAKVHNALRILGDAPILQAAPVLAVVIIDDLRDGYPVLGKPMEKSGDNAANN